MRELSAGVAIDAEQQADNAWLWKGRHAKLVDGFTFTMPDTEENQARLPHPRTRKKGGELPIARSVAILSLATAMVMDVVYGPYKRKETGETEQFRQMIAVVTTLTDIDESSKEEIAELYRFRWNSELDIRSIKMSLNLAHVRCKSPQMVGIELRTTFLAYNLIRLTALSTASLSGQKTRTISFTGTCQLVLVGWETHALGLMTAAALQIESRAL